MCHHWRTAYAAYPAVPNGQAAYPNYQPVPNGYAVYPPHAQVAAPDYPRQKDYARNTHQIPGLSRVADSLSKTCHDAIHRPPHMSSDGTICSEPAQLMEYMQHVADALVGHLLELSLQMGLVTEQVRYKTLGFIPRKKMAVKEFIRNDMVDCLLEAHKHFMSVTNGLHAIETDSTLCYLKGFGWFERLCGSSSYIKSMLKKSLSKTRATFKIE